jgi:MFS family permease
LVRLTLCWSLLADVVPLYALYAVFFAQSGLDDVQISVLFAVWSTVGIVGEVPSGALADRFSRRACLVAAGVFQAAGYALWMAAPGFAAFAGGFVLWGIGGVLTSGALEALLYDGMVAAGAGERYGRLMGWVRALGLLAQIPAAAIAALLFALGGFGLVGWVSVAGCLGAAALALRFQEPPRSTVDSADSDETEESYLATLRTGISEAVRRPAVRTAVVAVMLLTAIDAFEEYFALMAQDWGVPVVAIPAAVVGLPLAGAIGAALGGRGNRLRTGVLAVLLGGGAVLLGAAGVAAQPGGLVAVAAFYAVYRMVLVIADVRLQETIDGPARATVTSVAALGTDLACMLVYLAWSLGHTVAVAALTIILAAVLPRLLPTTSRVREPAIGRGGRDN